MPNPYAPYSPCLPPAPPVGLLRRLDAKLDKRGGPHACWPWRGGCSRGQGRETVYPVIWSRAQRGQPSTFWRVCRLVLLLEELPLEAFRSEQSLLRWLRLANQHRGGLEAAHSCDNSRCGNARHLAWQPHARNVREQAERRAQAREGQP